MPIDRIGTPKAVLFLDLDFSALSFAEALVEISSCAARPGFAYVVTPNVDHVVKLNRKNEDQITIAFRSAYDAAALRLCDSRVLARLALLFGIRMPVVPGSDLTAALFDHVIGAGDRVAIIGGAPDTIARLRALYPAPEYLQHVPPMGMLANPAAMNLAADFVTDSGTDYVLFCVGAPQSEILAHRCALRGATNGVGLCIGASIDFLLSDQRRAPRWIQRAGFEWAYRLSSNPSRLWRRYLVEGPRIFLIAARWGWARRRGGSPASPA